MSQMTRAVFVGSHATVCSTARQSAEPGEAWTRVRVWSRSGSAGLAGAARPGQATPSANTTIPRATAHGGAKVFRMDERMTELLVRRGERGDKNESRKEFFVFCVFGLALKPQLAQ
jgi:hypothetical protein